MVHEVFHILGAVKADINYHINKLGRRPLSNQVLLATSLFIGDNRRHDGNTIAITNVFCTLPWRAPAHDYLPQPNMLQVFVDAENWAGNKVRLIRTPRVLKVTRFLRTGFATHSRLHLAPSAQQPIGCARAVGMPRPPGGAARGRDGSTD